MNITHIHNIFKNLNDCKEININDNFQLKKLNFLKKLINHNKNYYPTIIEKPFIDIIISKFYSNLNKINSNKN